MQYAHCALWIHGMKWLFICELKASKYVLAVHPIRPMRSDEFCVCFTNQNIYTSIKIFKYFEELKYHLCDILKRSWNTFFLNFNWYVCPEQLNQHSCGSYSDTIETSYRSKRSLLSPHNLNLYSSLQREFSTINNT